jgi:hypothetical protein
MLAEIFMLRLEVKAREGKEAAATPRAAVIEGSNSSPGRQAQFSTHRRGRGPCRTEPGWMVTVLPLGPTQQPIF